MRISPFELLLVEDNPSEVRLAKEAMSLWTEPCNLSVAIDGREALDFLNDRNAPRPDLILLDLNLPTVSGLDVLRYVKTHPTFRYIPVVVMSNSRSPTDVQLSYDLQANCFVEKPISLDEIMDVFKHLEHFWVRTVRTAKLMNSQGA